LALRADGLPFAHRLDAGAARREERRVLSHADAAVVFTERDRQLVTGAAPVGTEVVTIPLGWDVPTRAADPHGGDPPTLLFVGNFNHPPNVAAAVTVVREILPRVRASHPEVVAEIVGASPPPEVLSLAGRGVRVTGPVPTVSPHLDQAAVVLAPLTIGGGVRIKVLEALAAGKAVVASSRAVEGVTARPGEALVVADGVAEMAAAVVHLLENRSARLGVASRARTWAVRELSWSSMADRYEQLYARLERRLSARS
jgi:glycosyltransferase involved in cell wall biosynthesis